MHQISISDLTIDIVRKNIKHMHLSVYPPTGRIRIAAPLSIDDDAIRLFAISKLPWIRRSQRGFAEQERQPPRSFVERESHYFEGKRYLLKVIEHNAPPKMELRTKTRLHLFVRPGTTARQRQTIVNAWYRQQLKGKIPAMIGQWEQAIGVAVSDWGVKQMKTKWGTCNVEQKRIWINLELAKKPVHCLEYIVVHEMLHLIERHHNARFFALLEKHLPRWKSYKEDLNRLPISHGEWTTH